MSMSVTTQWSAAFVRRLVRGWRSWTCRTTTADEMRLGAPEDADPRTFAGRWPDAADRLSRRLAALRM